MQATILTLATLAATVVADLGSGIIINACDYKVDLMNVPSADGVHEQYGTTLAANGGTFSQKWTSLANANGWSMKLNPIDTPSSIMQFEYTYSELAPEDLWFDLSYVDGRPFVNEWEISSSSDDCVVKQTAYNNPTDDANGMQPLCSPEVSITVTLCPANVGKVESSTKSKKVATSTKAEEPSTTAIVISLPEPTTTAEATSETALGADYFNKVAITTPATTSPTTFATKTTSTSTQDNGAVVTEVDTVIATQVVTVYGHGHHPRHAHHHGRN